MKHYSPPDQLQRSWARLRAHASDVVCGDLSTYQHTCHSCGHAGAGNAILQRFEFRNGRNDLHLYHSLRMYGTRTIGRCARSVCLFSPSWACGT
jgi:hypothetical protein